LIGIGVSPAGRPLGQSDRSAQWGKEQKTIGPVALILAAQSSEYGMDWDARFAGADYLFGTEPVAFAKQNAGYLPDGARLLSVADGEGRNAVFFAAQGHDVTTFDISPNALQKAQALAKARGVALETHVAGFEDWVWEAGAYDAIVGIFFQFLGPAARTEAFRNFDTALRPGGLLLLHGFAPRQVGYGTGGPKAPENMYTLDLLRAAFDGYDVLHAADYDAENSSGEAHTGKAALVDFVARKP
jgi:SAM-dependent methyltransferase